MEFLKNIFDWTMSILGWLLSSLWDIIVWLFTNWEVTLGGIIALVVLSFVVGIISSIGSTLKARAERKAEEAAEKAEIEAELAEQARLEAEEAEKKRLFYMCKSCGKDDAREKIDTEWLNVEFIGNRPNYLKMDRWKERKKINEDGNIKHKIKIKHIYQCKFCDDRTEEITEDVYTGDFWTCDKCGKDEAIKQSTVTDLEKFPAYKELWETTAKGERKKIQARIMKIREQIDYECSHCGYKFTHENVRELE